MLGCKIWNLKFSYKIIIIIIIIIIINYNWVSTR
jgi:hypothetical protein